MTYQTIIGKIAEIQHVCTISLSKWLEWCLPKISNQWWNKCVISRLSDEQKQRINTNDESNILKLDLAALLRILSSNRNDLLNRRLIQPKDRTTIEKMFDVRNRWAHLSSNMPAPETILEDLQTTIDLLVILPSGKDTPCKEIEKFAEILRREGITDIPNTIEQLTIAEQNLEPSKIEHEIKQNSIIRLKSNPEAKGMVSKIDFVDGKKKYEVFIDKGIKSFYEGQIELDTIATAITVSIDELRQFLIAFQINKPSYGSLYSLNAAKVDFEPYQFRPALKLIKSDVPRLLIADSVGVGKTIEAGLILKELHARAPLNNVLIICPKPLVAERKWEMEMKDKFNEDFIPIDGGILRNILKDCNDGEWPSRFSRAIIPYSILSSELMNGFNDIRPRIPGLEELDPKPHFDLVIVDEAHHIRNSNTNAYKAVRYFCENADAVVFMTATPLQLGDNDLFTLLNVLFPNKVIDKATFDAMTAPNNYIHKAIRNIRLGAGHESEVIELLQSAAKTEWGQGVITSNPLYSQVISAISKGGLSREDRVRLIDSTERLGSLSNMINRTRRIDIADNFCIRDAHPLRSHFTMRQQELYDALINFEIQVLTTLHNGKNVKFMMSTLQRQAASCIFGLAPSIEDLVHRGIRAITDSYDFEDNSLKENEANTIFGMAANLIELSKNLPEEDEKLEKLLSIIRKKQEQDNNKIILFTTFKHTQRYLEQKIKQYTSLRVAAVNGEIKDDDRYNLRERFAQSKSEENAIDMLLFTEVGSEGLDYQFCNTMVNYDLPWNPMRIEQRIGRIDRRGQHSEKVHIYNCITDGTIDADIFDRCLERIGIFEQNMGDCAEILGKLAEGIEKIVFDSSLSPEQCAEKLEKLADNETSKIVEMQRLENESKELFGIDISDFTDSLNRADNQWLSANSIKQLIEGYLEKRLNDGKKHLDGKLLRLSADAKLLLKEDYNAINIKDKIWNGFLKSLTQQSYRIAFEQDEARNDPKAIFINPTHPLARQAATFFASDSEIQIALSVSTADVSGGTYPFKLYSWEYTGERPQIRLEPVCENEWIRNEFHNILRSAIHVSFDANMHIDMWKVLESSHMKLWEKAKAKYREDAQNLCNYKIESLTQSHSQRIKIAEARALESISKGEIANLTVAYEAKVAQLKDIAEKADIHISLLVKGVIIIKEEEQ